MFTDKENSWTVEQILDGLEQGIFWLPHFQRGGVWTPEMGLKLLDSLYLGTPCGSLVAWTPGGGADPTEWGVPIASAGDSPPRFLVDGQQRVRAIKGAAEAFGGCGDPSGDKKPLWLYLPNVPELSDLPDGPGLRRLRSGIFFRDDDVRDYSDDHNINRRERRGGGGASVLVADLLNAADAGSARQDEIADIVAKQVPDLSVSRDAIGNVADRVQTS